MKILLILLSTFLLVTNTHALRIVSVAPSITENLYHIGAADDVIGVTDFCNYPPEAKQKTTIGSYYKPNIEKILMLKPDMVIGMKEGYTEQLKNQLDRFNIPNTFYSATTINDIVHIIRDLGRITGKNTLQVENKIHKTFSSPPIRAHTAFFLLSTEPIYTVGQHSFINSIMACAGLQNITEKMTVNYPQISIELIFQKKPDIIIESGMDAGNTHHIFRKRVKDMGITPQFIRINPDMYNRASYRIVDACSDLKEKLSPQQEPLH